MISGAMNSRTPLLLLFIAATLIAVTGCETPVERGDSEATFLASPIDPATPLLVTIRFAGRDSTDRYYYASQAVSRTFLAKNEWSIEIRRWAANVGAPDAQRLDLNFVTWKQDVPDRIDCLISASLRNSAGARVDLGSFTGNAYGLSTALGEDAVNEIYVKAAEAAIANIYARLGNYVAD